MITICHGIEYYIFLNESIDMFDIVPDIMKKHKYIINYHEHINALCIIRQKQSDDRLLESEYYKSNKDKWFSSSTYKCVKIEDEIVKLTTIEKDIIHDVLNHDIIKNNIKEYGWYDILIDSYN